MIRLRESAMSSMSQKTFLWSWPSFWWLHMFCLFFSFIRSSIQNRSKSMKTMKSLGIDNRSIFSIFWLQAELITLVSLFIATFIYLGATIAYGYELARSYILISPLSFNFWVVLLCLAFSVIFSSLLAFLFSLPFFKKGKIRKGI